MTATSNASRKSAERQRRKEAGEVRVEVWLKPEAIEWLETVMNGQLGPTQAISYALFRAAKL